jgi:hypothetical protein
MFFDRDRLNPLATEADRRIRKEAVASGFPNAEISGKSPWEDAGKGCS